MRITRLIIAGSLCAGVVQAQEYAKLPIQANMDPVLTELAAMRAANFLTTTAACPAVGATSGPGNTPSPATTEQHIKDAIAAMNTGANVLCIAAGTTIQITSPIVINRSAAGTTKLYIRTSSNALPGRRMMPGADFGTAGGAPASYQARLIGTSTMGGGNAQPIFKFERNARRWYVIGIDVTTDRQFHENELIRVGEDTGTPSNAQQYTTPYTSDIYFDRVIGHGKYSNPINTRLDCGLRVRAERVGVQRSAFYDARGGIPTNPDSNAIGVLQSKGQIVIENNYLEAAGESFMIGGGMVPGTPKDVIFRGNYLTKNQTLKNGGYNVMYNYYAIKNLFEIKYCERCLIEGNLMEGFYITPTTCDLNQALAFKIVATNQCREWNPDKIWSRDITVRYNRFNQVAEMFGIGNIADYGNCLPRTINGTTYSRRAIGTDHVVIQHNLVTELGWMSRRAYRSAFLEINYPRPVDPPYPALQNNLSPPYYTVHDLIFENNTLGSLGNQGDEACSEAAANPNVPPPIHWMSYFYQDPPTGNQQAITDNLHIRNNVMQGDVMWTKNGHLMNLADYNNFLANHGTLITKNIGGNTQSGIVARPPNYAPAATYSSMFVSPGTGNFRLSSATCGGVACNTLTGTDSQPVGVNMTTLEACTAGAATDWTGYGSCPGQTDASVSITSACNACVPPITATGDPITVPTSSTIRLAYTLVNCTTATKGGNWSGTIAGPNTSGTADVVVTAPGPYTYSLNCGSGVSDSVTINIAQEGIGEPTNEAPADGSITISRTPLHQWSAATGASTYEILRDTTTPPTTLTWTTTDLFYLTPPSLAAGTTYYWRVVARDPGPPAVSASGAIWSFTTPAADPGPPDTPTYISPADAATAQNPTLLAFEWSPAARATSYALLLDTVNPPVSTAAASIGATTYEAAGLLPATVYYWQVKAKDVLGRETAGAVWSFTTASVSTGCPATGAC